jgi:hypothetical protein
MRSGEIGIVVATEAKFGFKNGRLSRTIPKKSLGSHNVRLDCHANGYSQGKLSLFFVP